MVDLSPVRPFVEATHLALAEEAAAFARDVLARLPAPLSDAEGRTYDVETIADLSKIPALLQKRGYTSNDIENVMHGNWLRFLRNAWK
jgi:hypothetical protein